MRIAVSIFVLLVFLRVPAGCSSLTKIAEVDLRVAARAESRPTAEAFIVHALAFSPSGRKIAAVVDVLQADQRYLTEVLIVDAADPGGAVRRFNTGRAIGLPFVELSPIEWSPDETRLAVEGTVYTEAGAAYCGRGSALAFLDSSRVLAYIGRTVRLADGRESAGFQLTVTGPECGQEHPLAVYESWAFLDIARDSNLGLFSRSVTGSRSNEAEIMAVGLPDLDIRRSWHAGSVARARFVNGGRAVCVGSAIGGSRPVIAECRDVETGRPIAQIPVNGGWPIAAAASASRLVASDLRRRRIFFTDAEYSVIGRRVLWDYSTGRKLATWSPRAQAYPWIPPGRRREIDQVPSACALSPDGTVVAEGANGVLRLYRVSE